MYLTLTLHHALQRDPNGVMTVCGDRTRTTTEVIDRVARLAGGLKTLGVVEGDRVGILALNSDRFHELSFASWWLGAAVHPINIRWSVEEIAYAVNDSATEVLVVDDTFVPMVEPLRERCPALRVVVHGGDGEAPDGLLAYEAVIADAHPLPDSRTGGDAMAFLLYTGGTTGRPKGVMISHDGLMASLFGTGLTELSSTPDGVALLTAPLFHIAAILGWYEQLLVGGTCVFAPQFTAQGFLDAVQQHRVTSCILLPIMVQMILDHPDFASYDLSSLEKITYGGASSSDTMLHRALAAFPDAEFLQGYGMTETGVLTMLGAREHREPGLPHVRSAGRVVKHAEVAVVDADGHALPPGQLGEIVTRGDHVMMSYWHKPEETAAALRDGWMHTGDGGYFDEDGYLYIADRIKDMIISGGENVYSAEVENALATHPAVAECAVIAVPDDHWGERVHAIIVLREGQTASFDEIKAHCAARIAGYKCPRSVEFVGSLPRSALGKLLKTELRSARRPS